MRIMQNFSLLLLGLLFLAVSAYSEQWANDQGSAYTKGEKDISVGLALWQFGLGGAFDYGFHEAISAGYLVGIMIFPDAYVPMIVRAAFHPFNLTALKDKISVRDKLDVYAGLSSGFKIGYDPLFTFGEYIGVKYLFTPKFGVFAEDCAGVGYINFGLSFKL